MQRGNRVAGIESAYDVRYGGRESRKAACDGRHRPLRNSITWALAGRKPAVQSYKADKPKNGVIQTGEYSGAAPNDDELSVYVGTNVEYAPYVELGTSRQEAQPFLKPAAAGSKNALEQCFKKAFEE